MSLFFGLFWPLFIWEGRNSGMPNASHVQRRKSASQSCLDRARRGSEPAVWLFSLLPPVRPAGDGAPRIRKVGSTQFHIFRDGILAEGNGECIFAGFFILIENDAKIIVCAFDIGACVRTEGVDGKYLSCSSQNSECCWRPGRTSKKNALLCAKIGQEFWRMDSLGRYFHLLDGAEDMKLEPRHFALAEKS